MEGGESSGEKGVGKGKRSNTHTYTQTIRYISILLSVQVGTLSLHSPFSLQVICLLPVIRYPV